MLYYFDTSALTKLVVKEVETFELIDWNGDHDPRAISSGLTRTELIRAVRRRKPELAENAREALESIELMTVDTELFEGRSTS